MFAGGVNGRVDENRAAGVGAGRPDVVFWLALAALAAFALALRLLAGRGGLWLDEAWSAVFARDAGTAAGVFLSINHDNNHFANTLWLQAVGWGAPPPLSRGLSILCGTAAVAAGGIVARRRGRAAALMLGVLLALSPILVTYGSEARGYAPMVLALIVAFGLADRWLLGEPVRGTPYWLGLAAALGLLAHLTMLFGIAAIGGWIGWTLLRQMPVRRAAAAAIGTMRWALAAAIATAALVAGVAWQHGGYRIGSVAPFSLRGTIDAVGQMLAYAFGAPPAAAFVLPGVAAALIAVAVRRLPELRPRAPFYLLAIVGLPLAVILPRLGNSGYPRYFLVGAVAALLFAADLMAAGWRRGGLPRVAACLALLAFVAGSVRLDGALLGDRRGDPALAVAAMRAKAPGGTAVAIDNGRSAAVLEVAAATPPYRLAIRTGRCAHAAYLYVDEDGWAPLPVRTKRCGTTYRAIAGDSFAGLSGMTWQLYEAVR